MPETVFIKEELPLDYLEVADVVVEPPEKTSQQQQLPPPPPDPPAPAPSLPPPSNRPPRIVPRPIESLRYSSHSPPPLAPLSTKTTPWRVQEDDINAPDASPSLLQVESGVGARSGNAVPPQDALATASHPPPTYPTLRNPPPAVAATLPPCSTLIQLQQNQTALVPGYLESPTTTALHLTSAPIVIPYSPDSSSTLQQPANQSYDQAPLSYLEPVMSQDGHTLLVARYVSSSGPVMQEMQQRDLYVENNRRVASVDNANSIQPRGVLPPNATRSYPVAQTRNVLPNSHEGTPRQNQVNRFVPLTELRSSQPQSVTYAPKVFVNDRRTQGQSESQRNIVADPIGLVVPPAPQTRGTVITYSPKVLVNKQPGGQNKIPQEWSPRENPVTRIVISTSTTPAELRQTQVTCSPKVLVKNHVMQKQQMPNRSVTQDSPIPKKALESRQILAPTSSKLRELITSDSGRVTLGSRASAYTQSVLKQELRKNIPQQVSRVSPVSHVVTPTSTGSTVQRTLQSVRARVDQNASMKTNTKASQEQLQGGKVSQQPSSKSPVNNLPASAVRRTTVQSVRATCGSTILETTEKNSRPSEKETDASASRPLLVDLTDTPPVIDLTETGAPAPKEPSHQLPQPPPPPSAVASVRPRVSGAQRTQEATPAEPRHLTRRQELQLVREMTELAASFDGLSADDVVRLTKEFLEDLDLDVISSSSESEAEKNLSDKALTYVRHLLKHYSRLKAAIIQYERKQQRFHTRLEVAIRKGSFESSRVFTVDAAPLCIIANQQLETDALPPVVSVLAAVSAAGWTSTPLLVIAGDNDDKLPIRVAQGGMSVDGVRGVWYALSKDGRVTASLFLNWLRHFLDRLQCSPQKPVLMVMIDHPACKNLAMLKLCRSRGVVLVGLPRDSTLDSPLLPAGSRALLTCLRHVFNFILGVWGKKQEGDAGKKCNPINLYPERLALCFKFAFVDTLRRLGYAWGISSFYKTFLPPLKSLPAITNYPDFMFYINMIQSQMPSSQSMAPVFDDLQQQIQLSQNGLNEIEMNRQTPEVLNTTEEKRKRIKEAKIQMQAKKLEWSNAIRKKLQTGGADNVQNQNTLMQQRKEKVLPQTVQTNHVVGSESSKDEIQNQNRILQQNKRTLEPSIQQVKKTPEQLLQLELRDVVRVFPNDFEVGEKRALPTPSESQTNLPQQKQMQPSTPQAPGLSMNVEPQPREKTCQTVPLAVGNSRQKKSGENLSSCFTKEMYAASEFIELQPEANVNLTYIDDKYNNKAEEFIDVSELMYLETRIEEVEPNRFNVVKVHTLGGLKAIVDETVEKFINFNDSNGDLTKEISGDGTERLFERLKERTLTPNRVPSPQADGENLTCRTACTDSQTSVAVGLVSEETQRPNSKVSMDTSSGTSRTALGDKPFAWPLKQYSCGESRRVAVVAPQGVTSHKNSNINLSQGGKSSCKNSADSAHSPNDTQEKPVVKKEAFPDSWGCEDKWDDKSRKQKKLWENVIVLDDSDSETEICYSNVNVRDKIVVKEELSCQFGSKDSQNSSSDHLQVFDSTVQVLPYKLNSPEQSLRNSVGARSKVSSAPDCADNLSSSCVPKETSLSGASNKSLESKCSPIPSTEEASILSEEISNSSLPLSEVTCSQNVATTSGCETPNSRVQPSVLVEDSSKAVHNNFRSRKNTKPKKRTDNIVLTKFDSELNCSSPKKKSNTKPKADDKSNSNSQLNDSRIKPVVVLERLPPNILHLFSTTNKRPPKKEVVRVVKRLLQNLESSRATNLVSKKRKLEPCDKVGGKKRHSICVDNDTVSSVQESSRSSPEESSLMHSYKGKTTVCATPPLCIYCGDFGPGEEIWVKCVKCLGWAHADCSGAIKSAFECDYCVYTKR